MSIDTRKNAGSTKKPSIRKSSGEPADWKQASATLVVDAICAATLNGGALRFGYSRDGGAFAVGIYEDGEMSTEFVKPSEDIDIFLQEVIDHFDANGDPQPTAKKPTRTT